MSEITTVIRGAVADNAENMAEGSSQRAKAMDLRAQGFGSPAKKAALAAEAAAEEKKKKTAAQAARTTQGFAANTNLARSFLTSL